MPRIALAIASVLLLVGCTSSSDNTDRGGTNGSQAPSGSPTTALPTGPDCTGIWQAGATLPKDYKQCIVDGALGEQEVIECTDGTSLVAYDDAYYAITGSKISKPDVAPMQDTEDYGKAYGACTGE